MVLWLKYIFKKTYKFLQTSNFFLDQEVRAYINMYMYIMYNSLYCKICTYCNGNHWVLKIKGKVICIISA